MTVPVWWTPVDSSELETLVVALFLGARRHRLRCSACEEAGAAIYCRSVDRAIREILDWYELRSRLSRAEWLAAEKHKRTAASRPIERRPL